MKYNALRTNISRSEYIVVVSVSGWPAGVVKKSLLLKIVAQSTIVGRVRSALDSGLL